MKHYLLIITETYADTPWDEVGARATFETHPTLELAKKADIFWEEDITPAVGMILHGSDNDNCHYYILEYEASEER